MRQYWPDLIRRPHIYQRAGGKWRVVYRVPFLLSAGQSFVFRSVDVQTLAIARDYARKMWLLFYCDEYQHMEVRTK